MNCTNCTAEVTNGLALCAKCRQTLTVALVNVAAYHADVLRIRPGERVKVRSTYQSTPPPGATPTYDPISDVADAVATMVYTWCLALVDDRPTAGKIPGETTTRCGWLEHHIPSIATLEWAAELLRDALAAERKLVRILDKADTGWYAGRCGSSLEEERIHDGTTCLCACHNGIYQPCDMPGGCGSEVAVIAAVTCERGLYATTGQSWIRCPECGTTHNVADRRAAMMDEAREQVAPVAVIARAVVGLIDTEASVERLANRIDQWVSRGQLHDLGVRVLTGNKPQRVYRIGDVFDLLERNLPRNKPEAC